MLKALKNGYKFVYDAFMKGYNEEKERQLEMQERMRVVDEYGMRTGHLEFYDRIPKPPEPFTEEEKQFIHEMCEESRKADEEFWKNLEEEEKREEEARKQEQARRLEEKRNKPFSQVLEEMDPKARYYFLKSIEEIEEEERNPQLKEHNRLMEESKMLFEAMSSRLCRPKRAPVEECSGRMYQIYNAQIREDTDLLMRYPCRWDFREFMQYRLDRYGDTWGDDFHETDLEGNWKSEKHIFCTRGVYKYLDSWYSPSCMEAVMEAEQTCKDVKQLQNAVASGGINRYPGRASIHSDFEAKIRQNFKEEKERDRQEAQAMQAGYILGMNDYWWGNPDHHPW